MLQVDIVKRFPDFTLDVAFELGRERLALFGPSGSGKSLTLKCIAGIETPDEGRIVLNGRTLFDSAKKINLPPRERLVGLLFQSYALFPNMNLRQNILMGQREKNRHKVDQMIRDFSLSGLEELYPHQLSGGQQQRVALARMLVNNPEIVLLDEPFSALDTHLRVQVEYEVLAILEQFSGAAIIVSHNMNETYRFANRIAIFQDGNIEDLQPRDQLFHAPSTINGARLVGLRNISPVEKTAEGSYLSAYGLSLPIAPQKPFLAFSPTALSVSHEPSEGYPFHLVEVMPEIYQDIWLLQHDGPGMIQISRPKGAPVPPAKQIWLKIDFKDIIWLDDSV